MKASWLIDLIKLLVESFIGWMKKAGRDELEHELETKHDDLETRFREIDGAPADGSAIERLRAKRRTEHPGGAA